MNDNLDGPGAELFGREAGGVVLTRFAQSGTLSEELEHGFLRLRKLDD